MEAAEGLLLRDLVAGANYFPFSKKKKLSGLRSASRSSLGKNACLPSLANQVADLADLYLKPPSGPLMCSIGKRSSNNRLASIPIPLFVR
ncbi:hypothetical protein D3C87_358770 [compost metagenome]